MTQGYNFGGAKAERLLARLRDLKRHPDARRQLMGLPHKPPAEQDDKHG